MKYLTTLFYGILLTFCSTDRTVLERVIDDGELRVITRNSPTTYYYGRFGETGLEFDLASRFAEELGVELTLVTPGNFNEIIPAIADGRAHFAAAGLTVTAPRKDVVRFGPTYQTITEQLVYRAGTERPLAIDAVAGANLEVVAGSSHVETLEALRAEHPNLAWTANTAMESHELLELVWNQLIEYTVADSNLVSHSRRFRPELRVAFDVSEPRDLAWAFPRSTDDSLYIAAVGFFNRLRKSGELERIIDRHYGHIERQDFVTTTTFLSQATTRLPEYRKLFVEVAREHDLDWHLLAAVSYQESHWNPDAKSPTGVRGLMMLTRDTAKMLGIENRRDPRQSVVGGARYLKRVRDKIPERIEEPDRTWMALAAYNVGFGHLEDARKITQQQGGDPDKWIDVRERLPLLAKKKWYKNTRHGYARGHEPVNYVRNIRRYYDMLVWLEEHDLDSMEDLPASAIYSPVL